ncbi:heavy metal translocating P-type ATPase [Propionibacterium sp.]|uniref:heavy metal translocating P-type ATPase n=1 Tax=Propionibacterium sp. TaxID=1977903 RepID=UPI0039E8E357
MTDTVDEARGAASGVMDPDSPQNVPAPDLKSIDLDVSGMTCASCAAHIQKKLNKVDGVRAAVNYATNKAHVLAPAGTTSDQLIEVVRNAGYDASLPTPEVDGDTKDQAHADAIRRRLIVSAILSVPVVAVAMVTPWQFPGWQWMSLALATPVVLWGGFGFHRAAWLNLRHGSSTMDTLISVGTLAAYVWSTVCLIFGSAGEIGMRHAFSFHLMRSDALSTIYFEAACGTITFILLGRWIEAKSRRQAGSALRELLKLGAREVRLLGKDGAETMAPIEALSVGQRFVVRPGEKIASDGVVREGHSAVDAHVITGESVPVEVGPGDHAVGATLNTVGRLVVEATAVGSDTQLAQIATLVEQAQTGKSNAQRLADKIASIFVPVVFVIAFTAFLAWLIGGAGIGFAITAGVAVLIISCPCALGLATPTALLAGTGRGAQLGIVIRGPQALEQARHIDTVVTDKTGTLTKGEMVVQSVHTAPGADRDELLSLAAALESGSEHPIAEAIVAAATKNVLGVAAAGPGSSMAVENSQILPGRGVEGVVDGVTAFAGTAELMTERGLEIPHTLHDAAMTASGEGASVVFVGAHDAVQGLIAVSDEVSETSARAVKLFGELGLHTVMLTGDNERAAKHIASLVGIDEVHAQVLPDQKMAVVTELQESGRRVAMVGDGVNDAAALAQSNLGIAVGSGTDAAIAASDLTLMRHDLVLAVDALRLSRATLGTIRVNLFWAFFYNVCAIPIAAFGLLNPMIAGAAMAFSSVFVVTNSLRLRSFRATPEAV